MKQIIANGDFKQYWTAFPLVVGDIGAYEVVLKVREPVAGSFKVTAKKPNGNVQFVSSTVSGTQARTVLKNSMYDIAGQTEFYLELYDTEGNKVTEKVIFCEVETGPGEGTISNNEVTQLNSLMSQTTKYGSYASQQGDYAKEQGDYAKEQGDAMDEKLEPYIRVSEAVYDDLDEVPLAAGIYRIAPQPAHSPDTYNSPGSRETAWTCQVLKSEQEGVYHQVLYGGSSADDDLKLYLRTSPRRNIALRYTRHQAIRGSVGNIDLPLPASVPSSFVYEFDLAVNNFNTMWRFRITGDTTSDLFELNRDGDTSYNLNVYDGTATQTVSAFSAGNLAVNTFHRIKLKVDLTAQTFSLYINGTAAYENAAMKNVVTGSVSHITVINLSQNSGADNTSIYFDNISMYEFSESGLPQPDGTYLMGPKDFQERTIGADPNNTAGKADGSATVGDNLTFAYAVFGPAMALWEPKWTKIYDLTTGAAIGKDANYALSGGGAIGTSAYVGEGGGAAGSKANAYSGGAVGRNSSSYVGGAVGNQARAEYGAAVGDSAITQKGAAVGYQAQTKNSEGTAIDAVQLGTGINANEKTLQVYGKQVVSYDASNGGSWYLTDVGKLDSLETEDKTSITAALNEVRASSGAQFVVSVTATIPAGAAYTVTSVISPPPSVTGVYIAQTTDTSNAMIQMRLYSGTLQAIVLRADLDNKEAEQTVHFDCYKIG